jgi:hypothetical protein
MDNQQARTLQEALAFTDHAVEQLSAEIAGLNRRLAQALTRLARLEQRLDRLLAAPDGEHHDEQHGPPAAP